MIGYLEGKVKYSATGKIILFCNGIGFTVFVPSSLSLLINSESSLYIHTHLRDDNLSLYGFSTPQDLDLFELLISISGVGPKIGLAIMSTSSYSLVTNAIQTSNLEFFTSISGVGKKTAQRIILDLKSKIGKGDVNLKNLEGSSELTDTLTGLGFQRLEISKVISQIDTSKDLATQVRDSLKLLKK